MRKRIFSILLMLLVAFTLVACKKDDTDKKDPIQEKFDEVVETLNGLVGTPDEVRNDLQLPKTFRHGVTGEWKSSDESVLELIDGDRTITGKVHRPDHETGNKDVTLSVELTLVEDDEEHTHEWSLDLTIIALDPPAREEAYETFKEAYDDFKDGEFELENFRTGVLEFEGVKLYGKTTSGQYVATKDGTIAYIHGNTPSFKEGVTYDITAKIYDYFGFLQLDDVNVNESDDDIEFEVDFKDMTIDEINELALPNVDGHVVYPETWTLKDVKFLIDEEISSSNYNLVLVDNDFDPEEAERKEDGDQYFVDSVLVYYVVNDYDQLKALAGTELSKVEVIYEGYRDDKHIHYVTILSVDDHVHLDLTDELKVEMAKAALEIETNFTEEGTIDLVKEGAQGTEIEWSYKDSDDENNSLIDLETGEVSILEDVRVSVTLVATIKSGEVTDTKEFTVKIGEHKEQTIADALDVEVGEELMVRGVVTGLFNNNTYGFQDENGDSIALYSFDALEAGKEYVLIGTKDVYNGLPQLKDLEIVEENSKGLPEATPIDDILDDNDELEKVIGLYVSVEDLEVVSTKKVGDQGNVEVKVKKDDTEITLRYDNRVDDAASTDYLADLEVGSVLNYVGHVGWRNGPQLGYGPTSHFDEGWPEVVEASDHYELDFSELTEDTVYHTSAKGFEHGGLHLERINANISSSSDAKGVVLGIRKGNDWESPYLKINQKLKVEKVTFNVTNWASDAYHNIDYASKIVVQTSTNGTDWEDAKDFKTDWDVEGAAENELTVELDGSEVFVRLFVESAGTQEDYQLRLIVTSLELWLED